MHYFGIHCALWGDFAEQHEKNNIHAVCQQAVHTGICFNYKARNVSSGTFKQHMMVKFEFFMQRVSLIN